MDDKSMFRADRADLADKAGEADQNSSERDNANAAGDEALHMHKRVERKEDGRHLLYYSFGKEVQLPSGSDNV